LEFRSHVRASIIASVPHERDLDHFDETFPGEVHFQTYVYKVPRSAFTSIVRRPSSLLLPAFVQSVCRPYSIRVRRHGVVQR